MFQQSMTEPLEPPQYFITQFNALVWGLGSAYFPFTTSSLEQPALFLLKLRKPYVRKLSHWFQERCLVEEKWRNPALWFHSARHLEIGSDVCFHTQPMLL